jgi:hypothetical protein
MIEQHLQELLYTKESCNIPGQCYVTGKEIASSYSESSSTYSPPSKTFVLTDVKNEDDGLLITEIAKAEDNRAEAKLVLEKFVANVKKGLEEAGKFEISGIGVLSKKGNELKLDVSDGVNFREEVYGMKPFVIKPLSAKKEITPVAATKPVDKPVLKEAVTAPVEIKSTSSTTIDIPKEESKPVKKKSLVAVILVPLILLLLLGGGIYGGFVYGDQLLEMTGVTAMLAGDHHSGVDDDSSSEDTSDSSESEVHEEVHEDPVDTHEEVESTSFEDGQIRAISELSERYHIVAGAFSIEENARKFASRHNGAVIVRSGRLNLVLLGNYDSESEARQELVEYKSSVGQAVWLKIR